MHQSPVHPIIETVDRLLHSAIDQKASDIHCEPTGVGLRVRLRIDGILSDVGMLSADVMLPVVSRIKVLAGIDIAEKRIPQDGILRFKSSGRLIDCRIATFPSLYGEKVVIRILDQSEEIRKLDQLGLPPSLQTVLRDIAYHPTGLVLVTGPTGSGKTTTLYALLSLLNTAERNIVTIEDPVEYQIPGITQGQVNREAGFSFDGGIRSLLRQDPDVIMVGEIRDKETAAVAIEAALTGHLVFSTLHTDNAPSACVRLMDMGIEPFLITASLSLIISQRLLRTVCSQCAQLHAPTEQEQLLLNSCGVSECATVQQGAGCAACSGRGMRGRTGVFEFLTMSAALQEMITQRVDYATFYQQACGLGMRSLLTDAVDKVCSGKAPLHELARVAASYRQHK